MKQKKKIVFSLFYFSSFFSQAEAQSLQQLYDLADQHNQQITVSQTGLSAASEAVMVSKNAMLPNVELSASGSYIGDATLMSRGFSTSGTTSVILAGLKIKEIVAMKA